MMLPTLIVALDVGTFEVIAEEQLANVTSTKAVTSDLRST
jgi:hypothetical protein